MRDCLVLEMDDMSSDKDKAGKLHTCICFTFPCLPKVPRMTPHNGDGCDTSDKVFSGDSILLRAARTALSLTVCISWWS